MLLTITHLVFWTIFCLFLSIATITDFQRYIIPNWVVSSIFIAFTCYAGVIGWLDPLSPFPHILSATIAAVPVFAVSVTLTHFRVFGGGDAKLLSVASLWAGSEFIAEFLIVTMLAGGALAVCYLAYNAIRGQRVAVSTAGAAVPNGATSAKIPYAAAICVGGVFVTCKVIESFIL